MVETLPRSARQGKLELLWPAMRSPTTAGRRMVPWERLGFVSSRIRGTRSPQASRLLRVHAKGECFVVKKCLLRKIVFCLGAVGETRTPMSVKWTLAPQASASTNSATTARVLRKRTATAAYQATVDRQTTKRYFGEKYAANKDLCFTRILPAHVPCAPILP